MQVHAHQVAAPDNKHAAAHLAQRIGSDGALTPELAVVAVAAGDGMEQVLRSIGASAIVRGGQTMNPSAGELRKAIDSTGAAHVIMLPNNKNIVMAARQAAEAAKADVRVVPTTSIPQGVAALVALNVDAPLDENADSMEAARGAVRTAEITRAVRETSVNRIEVSIGQPIGMIDGTLAVAAATVADAALECVSKMVDGRDSALVTLYYGEGEDDTSASALASRIGDELSCEVEVIDGGQPHYAYIVGVE